jgi:predicted aspartyl protease
MVSPLGIPAITQQPAPTAAADVDEPRYAVPTTRDRSGRIVVPVMVNGTGPYRFVLDTGANTTVIAPHLAEKLGLPVDARHTFTLQGITGGASVPTALVDRLESGALVMERRRLAVANASVIGTDGILGADGMDGKVIMVDFKKDRVRVLDASRHAPPLILTRIPARIRSQRLLMIETFVDNHKVAAIIDSGGHQTLGNLALYRKLGLKPIENSPLHAAEVVGATDARQKGEKRPIRNVRMGGLRIARLHVTFGDFYIFGVWGLEDSPALIVGMDLIGMLDVFGVDYMRREVQVLAR